RRDPLEQAHRTQIDVLAEAAADRDQEPPERDVVGYAREPNGAQENRLELPELVETVLGHHSAGLRVAPAAPVERRPLEIAADPAAGGVQHALAFGHDLLTDPVAGNHRRPVPYGVVVAVKTF